MPETIDKRKYGWFRIDDLYIDKYASVCGIYATGIYASLCRHSDKSGACFPSKETLAKELKISQRSVYNGLRKLEEFGIITISNQTKRKKGFFKNNIYTLQDKSRWENIDIITSMQAPDTHGMEAPGARDRRHELPSKEDTYKLDTTLREAPRAEGNYEQTEPMALVAPPQAEVLIPKEEVPFSYVHELEALKNGGKNGSRKDFKIIALYWIRKRRVYENRVQFNEALRRELRPAKALMGYTKRQLEEVMDYCDNTFDLWTLETIGKRIGDLVNTHSSIFN